MEDYALTDERIQYIKRLAYRYAQYRRSAFIDAEDLASCAMTRWWQFCQQRSSPPADVPDEVLFRQQVKFAMKDAIRTSDPVKVSRSYQSKLKAYEMPYAVSLDHAQGVQTDESPVDPEMWMDVLSALKTLSEKEQILLSLVVEQGYSFTEVATVFGVAVSTVTRQYRTALDRVKKNLQTS
ncbi:MAG: sigma-70 family RNA polymerase sigma factor [Firmicutes bacterium]|nr:sigma-70 family RNA polymerase sigma factor [Bacillota bacterium]